MQKRGAPVGILEGKSVLVAGVTLDTSIAFHVARIAQAEGATVLVSNFGRAMSLTRRVIKKLDPVPPLLEVDVTNDEHLAGLADAVGEHVERLDGLVHSLAFANPETALGGQVPVDAVERRRHRRARLGVLAGLADDGLPAAVRQSSLGGGADLRRHRLLAGLRLDGGGQVGAGEHQPLPGALSGAATASGSTWSRPGRWKRWPRRRSVGRTSSTTSGPTRAPLGWDPKDIEPTARAVVALLSDWFPRTTGEMVHVATAAAMGA